MDRQSHNSPLPSPCHTEHAETLDRHFLDNALLLLTGKKQNTSCKAPQPFVNEAPDAPASSPSSKLSETPYNVPLPLFISDMPNATRPDTHDNAPMLINQTAGTPSVTATKPITDGKPSMDDATSTVFETMCLNISVPEIPDMPLNHNFVEPPLYECYLPAQTLEVVDGNGVSSTYLVRDDPVIGGCAYDDMQDYIVSVEEVENHSRLTDISTSQNLPNQNIDSTEILDEAEDKENVEKNKLTRKRRIDSKNWKNVKRKKNKDAGKKYTSCSGKEIPAKTVKETCGQKCQFECIKSFADEDRNNLLREYWQMADYSSQRDFILHHIKEKECATHKVHAVQRNFRKEFYLPKDGDEIRVCKGFFTNTLDISESVLDIALKKKREYGNGFARKDQRGHHPKSRRNLDDCLVNEVKKHIESFPTVDPHYVRKKSQRKYLDSRLNITKMYELYTTKMKERGTRCVRYNTYRHIFAINYNLSFHHPKKDQCSKCTKFTNLSNPSQQDISDYNLHKSNAKRAQEEKAKDKVDAQKNSTFRTATFDLQSVLYTPCSAVSSLYYTRKISVYNFTIFEQNSKVGLCFLWEEFNGKRGSCEVATCLSLYIKGLPSHIQKVSFFSDCCSGQNRNRIVAVALLHVLNSQDSSISINEIEQNFLEPGHTSMEVDSMHSSIESSKKFPFLCHPTGII